MALPARPMHVPAGLPLDEATRLELLDVGKANVAQRNVRVDELGALERRLGFAAMTSTFVGGETRTAGRKLFAHRDAPCVIDGTSLDTYSSSAEAWLRIGRVPECSYRERPLPTFSAQAILSDIEVCSGHIAAVVVDDSPGEVRLVVVDQTTGALVYPFTVLGGGLGLSYYGSVASVGTYFIAFIASPFAGSIEAFVFDTATPSSGWVALATVAASGVTTVPPSVCSLSDRVAITYGTTSGANRVVVKTYNAAGLVGSTTLAAGTTPVALDCDASDLLWVAWAHSGDVYATALSVTSLSTVVGAAAVWEDYTGTLSNMRICAGTTAQTARAFVHDSAGPAVNGNVDVASLAISGGVVVATAEGRVYNALPSSRPFCRDGRYYMTVCPSPTTTDADGGRQGLCVLVDWSVSTTESGVWYPVANIAPGLIPVASRTCKPCLLDASTWAIAFQTLRRGDLRNSGGGSAIGCSFAEVAFVDRDLWQTVSHQGLTYLATGLLCSFDGVRVTESGFLSRPLVPEVTLAGPGLTGTFRWVAIYEDVDAFGNVVVSGISDPTDATALTDETATLAVPPLSVSARYGADMSFTPQVAFYRTITGGSPPYYRVGAVAIDPTVEDVTLADSTSDATLETRPKLYAPSLPSAVGESLDRRAPPGLKHIISYAGMLIGSRGSSLFWSGQEVYGEATWFSPVFELPISGGEIVALAQQDGALVVFMRDRIYIVAGEAPSDNGAAGGLGVPRLIATDVGCIDPASVVSTSLGIFFQSDRGIELFSRAQSVEWIGEPIQDTLASYPVVTSAVVDVRNSLLRFTLARTITSGVVTAPGAAPDIAGKSVVFDLSLRYWVSVDDTVSRTAAQHACYLSDGYAWLSSGGVVNLETDGWLDEGEWIPASYTLPPWKLGLQQDHRIYEMMFLFERRSAAGLTIEVAEDFGAFAAITADKVWTEADIAAERKVSFRPREHGSAVQIRVSDTEPATLGTGRGLTWIGFSADIAPKQGATRGTPRINTELRR